MLNVMELIFMGFAMIITIFLIKSMYDRTKAIPRNIENINRILSESGFVVSRQIGKYNKVCDSHYFLYIDDVNKKWLLTSPFLPVVNKIRKFDDLLDYDFFDEDGSNITGKITQGLVGTMGAIGGFALGGLVGGVLGGAGTSKATKILPGMKGESRAFGFVIQTKDCDVNNPVLVFDFYDVVRQSMKTYGNIADKILQLFDTATKGGLNRSSSTYKKDIAKIQEMASVFDYIISANTRQ